MSFSVLFVCICVLYYCHRVATQLQLNISYHTISYKKKTKVFILRKACTCRLMVILSYIHISSPVGGRM